MHVLASKFLRYSVSSKFLEVHSIFTSCWGCVINISKYWNLLRQLAWLSWASVKIIIKKNISSNKKTIFERQTSGISSQKQRHKKNTYTSRLVWLGEGKDRALSPPLWALCNTLLGAPLVSSQARLRSTPPHGPFIRQVFPKEGQLV